MEENILREFERRILELTIHVAESSGITLDDEMQETLESEIHELLEISRNRKELTLLDPSREKGLLRKIFPAGLQALSDYSDLPDSPRVLTEQAALQVGIIGKSPSLLNIIHKALLIAETNARVLISGETGTGKDLLAKLIHVNSSRRHKELVIVNCGALDPHLAVSELFGHEPNSFTGADPKGKVGRIAAANGGTLFLDEVADLPQVAQAALLRVLDRGEIQTVGRAKPSNVDVRVICATHRNLSDMVEQGTFRADLYYRLFVAELHLPPLRERENDVMLLAWHILNVLHIEYGRSIPRGFTQDALELMRQYRWPGNIRQLNHVIEHAFIETSSDLIGTEFLPMLRDKQQVLPNHHNILHADTEKVIVKVIGDASNKMLNFLAANGNTWFSTSTLADDNKVSESFARVRLRALADAGVLEATGDRRGRRYRLAARYLLDFPPKNSDINSLGNPD